MIEEANSDQALQVRPSEPELWMGSLRPELIDVEDAAVAALAPSALAIEVGFQCLANVVAAVGLAGGQTRGRWLRPLDPDHALAFGRASSASCT